MNIVLNGWSHLRIRVHQTSKDEEALKEVLEEQCEEWNLVVVNSDSEYETGLKSFRIGIITLSKNKELEDFLKEEAARDELFRMEFGVKSDSEYETD
ncbi:hypothetical protein Tco_1350124 [Tanacetum coccineum]